MLARHPPYAFHPSPSPHATKSDEPTTCCLGLTRLRKKKAYPASECYVPREKCRSALGAEHLTESAGEYITGEDGLAEETYSAVDDPPPYYGGVHDDTLPYQPAAALKDSVAAPPKTEIKFCARDIFVQDLWAHQAQREPAVHEQRMQVHGAREVHITDSRSATTYRRGKLLGKGGFARCYELTDVSTNAIYAGKIIAKVRLCKPQQKEKIIREAELHRSLHHINVCAFHNFFEDDINMYMILENCNRKSLVHVLKLRKTLTEPEVRYYMQQLVSGCRYIHSMRIVHRDLKLGNMLLNDQMHMKIADFGLATRMEYEGEKKMTVCGTPNYIAPEVLQKLGHSYEADVWAMGCIMYTLLVGLPPFETTTLKETYARIANNEFTIPGFVSKPARELIIRLLAAEPESRPRLDAVEGEDFFTSGYAPGSLSPSCCDTSPWFPAHSQLPRPRSHLTPEVNTRQMATVGDSDQSKKRPKRSQSQRAARDSDKENFQPILRPQPLKPFLPMTSDWTQPNPYPNPSLPKPTETPKKQISVKRTASQPITVTNYEAAPRPLRPIARGPPGLSGEAARERGGGGASPALQQILEVSGDSSMIEGMEGNPAEKVSKPASSLRRSRSLPPKQRQKKPPVVREPANEQESQAPAEHSYSRNPEWNFPAADTPPNPSARAANQRGQPFTCESYQQRSQAFNNDSYQQSSQRFATNFHEQNSQSFINDPYQRRSLAFVPGSNPLNSQGYAHNLHQQRSQGLTRDFNNQQRSQGSMSNFNNQQTERGSLDFNNQQRSHGLTSNFTNPQRSQGLARDFNNQQRSQGSASNFNNQQGCQPYDRDFYEQHSQHFTRDTYQQRSLPFTADSYQQRLSFTSSSARNSFQQPFICDLYQQDQGQERVNHQEGSNLGHEGANHCKDSVTSESSDGRQEEAGRVKGRSAEGRREGLAGRAQTQVKRPVGGEEMNNSRCMEEEMNEIENMFAEGKACSAIRLYTMLNACLEAMPPDSSPAPVAHCKPLWVTKWVDYSNKYGFGFQFSDRSVGILFNDTTRMVLSTDGVTLVYNDLSNKTYIFTTETAPEEQRKKVTLLVYFSQYMDKHLIHPEGGGGGASAQAPPTRKRVSAVFIKKWFRTDRAIVMHLNNGTLQINFFGDHTKLILSVEGQDYLATYIDGDRRTQSFRLLQLQHFGCSPAIADRLQYARRMLEGVINFGGEAV